MPDIKSLINGFQREKVKETSPTFFPRLYDAFLELDRRIKGVEGSTGGSGGVFARVAKGTNLSVPDNTPTSIPFDVIVKQSGNIHDAGSSNTRFTISQAGYYLISSTVEWPNCNLGNRRLTILVNGTIVIDEELIPALAIADPISEEVSSGYFLNERDYVEIQVYQNSGGVLVIPAQTYSLVASVVLV